MLRSPLSRGPVSRVLGEAGKPPLFILPLTLTLTYTLRSESSSTFIGVNSFPISSTLQNTLKDIKVIMSSISDTEA